jgi:hypothetical protein
VLGYWYLGFSILDNMTLIQDAIVPLDGTKEVNVLPDDIIRSHHQVVMFHLGT